MAQQESARRSRAAVTGRVMAAAFAPGALAAAAPPQSAQSPHPGGRGLREVDLVSDIPGRAQKTDPNLVNSWGLGTANGLLGALRANHGHPSVCRVTAPRRFDPLHGPRRRVRASQITLAWDGYR